MSRNAEVPRDPRRPTGLTVPSGDHLWLIEAVYDRFRSSGEWPRIDNLQHAVDLAGAGRDVEAIADSLDRRHGWRNRGQHDTTELTLCGVALSRESTADLSDVLLVGRFAYGRYLESGAGIDVHSSEVAPQLGNDELRIRKVLVLARWLPGFGGGSFGPDGWTRQITRDIRRWRDVETVENMIDMAPCASESPNRDPLVGVMEPRFERGLTSRTAEPVEVRSDPLAMAQRLGRGSFSIRELGGPAATRDEFTPASWGGFVAMVRSLVTSNAFAHSYPVGCGDSPYEIVDTDIETLSLAMSDHAEVDWPLDPRDVPPVAAVMDLVEFLHTKVERANQRPGGWHRFFKHHHLDFDRTTGRRDYREQVSGLFRRHGLAFVMKKTGEVERVGSPVDRQRATRLPPSGDAKLDERLAHAVELYGSPKLDDRIRATRELWDCFERLKSSANPNNKRQSTKRLIRQLAGASALVDVVEADMRNLTDIGNQFGIRHAEVGQHALEDPSQLDYVFGRLFNLVWAVLRSMNTDTSANEA